MISPHPPSAPSPQGEGRWTRWFYGNEFYLWRTVSLCLFLVLFSPHPPAAPSSRQRGGTGSHGEGKRTFCICMGID
jgi:hypothetical protein